MIKKICSFILCFVIVCSCVLALPVSAQTTTKRGFINDENVRVRASATTKSEIITELSYVPVTVNSMTTGQEVFSGNNTWCHITYNGISGYVYSEYVNPIMDITYNDDFEANLINFPESYHSYLRALHAKYPNWKFVAHNLPLSFNDAVESQYNVSSVTKTRKWVEFNYGGNEWRDKRAYDAATNTWKTLETRWTYASRTAIEYFMDPRNSLNENDIFVFMQQSYDSNAQTKDTLRTVVAGTFLSNGYDKNYDGIIEADAYLDDIINAASQSGVSPFVIAATIIVEQGVSGNTNMISGTYPGFEGYYNFFNYTASGNTDSEIATSALTYAAKNGWTSREAAIVGGAKKYSNGYISIGQDTYYYKDFNVINQIWTHQYATALYDAWTNAKYLQKGCVVNSSASLIFQIPVYTDMTTDACFKPFSDGWQYVDGYWYYYSNGYLHNGWLSQNNVWYFLNDDGKMQTGWKQINNNWYFFNDNGAMLTDWQQIGSTWYFFAPNGAMHTGWFKSGNTWYYLNTNGAMHIGWQKIDDTWYFFASNGAMVTDWQQISSTWYYFAPNGAMHTGWLKSGDTWYYLNTNGAMLTGWQQVGKTWYFFNNNGAMATGWIELEGCWYYLNSNGAMHTGWLWDNAWYYLKDNGAMATNMYISGGYINSSGIWS